jgi:hypothetical protein
MLVALHIRAADRTGYRLALAGLTAMNMVLLAGGSIPPLYKAGVRYRRERPDRWDTADTVRARGYGDCEDLAAWRAAELRNAGEDAHADVYQVAPRKWHAIVRRADGTIEDPSRRLGMGAGRRKR